MSRRTIPLAALALAALITTGCGGGGGTEPRESVVVTPASQSRVVGETQQYSATVDGAAPAPGDVTWSSSNTAVATIDATTGLATAVGPGTTRIRAAAEKSTGEAQLTVVANTAPTVSAGADVDVSALATVTLSATGQDAEGQALTYRWTQTEGPDVTGGPGFLTGQSATFTAPGVVGMLRFSVVATDATGLASAADEIRVLVLEDRTKALWVRSTGDDAAAGTRAAPFRTVARAITQAATNGADVYVAEGLYQEAVTLRNGVSLYGGFANDWSTRYAAQDAAHRSILRAAGAVVAGSAVADLTVDGFTIEAETPTAAGGSTYGVRLAGSQRVTISRNVITAGAGRAGAAGGTGGTGATGPAGGNSPGEVTPGAGAGNGGGGGRGGTETLGASSGFSGLAGTSPNGGSGGAAASAVAAAGTGGTGGIGSTGSLGTGGAVLGGFDATLGYTPANGGTGGTGGIGGGGGGGGGGRNVSVLFVNFHGGGGGGGGGGGAGGTGGAGGQGGGGSFGIVVIASTSVVLRDNVITTGNGGTGGAGGTGGSGGFGGIGGRGWDTQSTDNRVGGNGGPGGRGGQGGQGGGGGGGPSVGIVVAGATTYTDTGNTITVASPGAGGGPNGGLGRSGPLLVIP